MEKKVFDLLIIGAGPAGLSAAVTARARAKSVLVLGSQRMSIKLEKAPHVDNYLGLPGITGKQLAEKFLDHCEKMNVEFAWERVSNIYQLKEEFQVMTERNNVYNGRTILIATGVSTAQALPREKELVGRGVSYCATCDGMFYKDKRVAVIAYTPEGEEEANFLADICNEVFYIHTYRGLGNLKETVKIISNRPKAILGEEKVSGVDLGEEIVEVDGIFIAREAVPVEELLPGLAMDNRFIKVDREMSTNVAGVFAAGDCTGKPYQISKSVGEGQVAALSAAKYIEGKI